MDAVLGLLNGITVWHWLGLALVLLGLEITLGTFDLLWVSGAAFLTSAWAALPLPAVLGGWQQELVFFAIVSLILLAVGRTVFADVRKGTPSDRPDLNQRGKSMIGKTGTAVSDFAGGEGRVKIGDGSWLASIERGEVIKTGTTVKVVAINGTILQVEAYED